MNQPSNPSGAVYSDAQIAALGDVLADHDRVLVLSDEIYEHILFDGRMFRSFAALCPGLKDRTLTVNGVSKAYAMTGWRIGYGAGHKDLIAAMTKVQSQISSGACSIAQAAAAAALNGPQDDVRNFCRAFEARRDLVVAHMAKIPGLTLDAPGGAFYALIGCAGSGLFHLGRDGRSEEREQDQRRRDRRRTSQERSGKHHASVNGSKNPGNVRAGAARDQMDRNGAIMRTQGYRKEPDPLPVVRGRRYP